MYNLFVDICGRRRWHSAKLMSPSIWWKVGSGTTLNGFFNGCFPTTDDGCIQKLPLWVELCPRFGTPRRAMISVVPSRLAETCKSPTVAVVILTFGCAPIISDQLYHLIIETLKVLRSDKKSNVLACFIMFYLSGVSFFPTKIPKAKAFLFSSQWSWGSVSIGQVGRHFGCPWFLRRGETDPRGRGLWAQEQPASASGGHGGSCST